MRLLAVCVLFACVVAKAESPASVTSWPQGPNSALTAAFCGSCHSLALVRQQRLDRKGWDKLLTWMSETQNMPVVDPALRSMLLDYLTTHFGLDVEDSSDAIVPLSTTKGGLQGIDAPPLVIDET